MTPNGKIKILTTTAMIEDVVKEIGGDLIDSLTLIKGDLDPHSYQLVKGDDEKFQFADLIFYNGLGLEHGPSLHNQLLHCTKAISLGNQIQRKYPERIIQLQGNDDPHIWMDVSLWIETIPIIVETLSQKLPDHRVFFQERGQKLHSKLWEAHLQIQKILQAIPENKRYLVTSHDAFHYFTRAYLANESEKQSTHWQKRFVAPEGLAPESQISAVDIQSIIEHLKTHQIGVIFPESNVNQDSIRKIVTAGREKGLQITIANKHLYGDAMGKKGSDASTYSKMMLHNAHTIADYLKGES